MVRTVTSNLFFVNKRGDFSKDVTERLFAATTMENRLGLKQKVQMA
jgi:hypothetical protein